MVERKKERVQILRQEEIAPGIYSLWIDSRRIAAAAKAGQFISIYSDDGSRMLPRPISICEIDREHGALRMVYRIAGAGTAEFSRKQTGDSLSVLGPLGNGFPLKEKKAFLIGGGIGIPPILELAKQLNCEKQLILGYRDSHTFLLDEMQARGRGISCHGGRQSGDKGECAGCSPGKRSDSGCDLCLRADAHAVGIESLRGRKSDGVLYFPGGEDGLRDRRLSGLCLQIERSGRSYQCP